MENLIEAIRIALHDDAEPIARRAGLVACRQIIAVLEGATGDEHSTTPDAVPASTPTMASTSAPGAAPTSAPNAAPASPPTGAPATLPTPSPAAGIDPATIATLIASFGKLPPEQLLDLAIARLRAALPPGTSVSAPAPLRFQLIPLHHLGRSK